MQRADLALDPCVQCILADLQRVVPRRRNVAFAHGVRLQQKARDRGIGRSEALRNFAERTGEPEFKKLVAILIQNDRFGTSIGQALRTHAETSRTKRRQRAEEKAGKLGAPTYKNATTRSPCTSALRLNVPATWYTRTTR